MPKRTLNVGLIGYNFMGKAHSNAWRQAPKFFDLPANVALKAICGRSEKSVEAARVQLGQSAPGAQAGGRRRNESRDLTRCTVPSGALATSSGAGAPLRPTVAGTPTLTDAGSGDAWSHTMFQPSLFMRKSSVWVAQSGNGPGRWSRDAGAAMGCWTGPSTRPLS